MDAEVRGIIGAFAGFALGLVDYFLATRVLEKARLENKITPEAVRIISVVAVVTSFVILPVVGYAIGRYAWG